MRIKSLLIFFTFFGAMISNAQLIKNADSKESLLKYQSAKLTKIEIQEYASTILTHFSSLSKNEKKVHYSSLLEQMLNNDMYKHAKPITDTLINLFQTESKSELASIYVSQSLIYDALGKYPEGLKASQLALNLFTELQDESGMASCYSDIGVFHYYRGDDSLSRNYLEQAFKIYQNERDSSGMAQCYNNIANTYFETSNYIEAINIYNKGLEIDKALNDIEGQSIFLSNIGETYTYLEEYDKAKEFLLESLKLAESSNDPWTISNPLRGLGELYQQLGDTEEAINVVKRSVNLCLEIDALPELVAAYNQLFTLYYSKGDYKEAIFYHELYHQTNDSIFNIEKEALFTDMEMQYQVNDKSQKLILAEKNRDLAAFAHQKEIDKNNDRQKLFLVILAGILIVLIIVFINVWQKKKANKLLLNQNKIIQDKNDKINIADRKSVV